MQFPLCVSQTLSSLKFALVKYTQGSCPLLSMHAAYGLYHVCTTTKTSARHSQPRWSPHAFHAPTACTHPGTPTRSPRQAELAKPLRVAALYITYPLHTLQFMPGCLSCMHSYNGTE